LQCFLEFMFLFLNMIYHISNPYKTFCIEMILKNAFESSFKFKTIVIHNWTSKVHYYVFVVYLLDFIIMYIFLFKLNILIQNVFATLIILTYICGIWIKIHFIESPIWHKNWATLSCNYPMSIPFIGNPIKGIYPTNSSPHQIWVYKKHHNTCFNRNETHIFHGDSIVVSCAYIQNPWNHKPFLLQSVFVTWNVVGSKLG
jgi:hypothetical protein